MGTLTTKGERRLLWWARFYCNVNADAGPIAVGDLLTTSDTPGHAMRVADPYQEFGAVIGKALRPLLTPGPCCRSWSRWRWPTSYASFDVEVTVAMSFKSFCNELGFSGVIGARGALFSALQPLWHSGTISLRTLMSSVSSPVPPDINAQDNSLSANPQIDKYRLGYFRMVQSQVQRSIIWAILHQQTGDWRASSYLFNIRLQPNGNVIPATVRDTVEFFRRVTRITHIPPQATTGDLEGCFCKRIRHHLDRNSALFWHRPIQRAGSIL